MFLMYANVCGGGGSPPLSKLRHSSCAPVAYWYLSVLVRVRCFSCDSEFLYCSWSLDINNRSIKL